VQTLIGHTDRITDVSISGNYVVTKSADKTVRSWDIKTGKCMQILATDVSAIAVNNSFLATGIVGAVKVWKKVYE
jgi:WD40 repeat protein